MNAHVTPMPAPDKPVEKKTRTITLTNRAPIQIVEDEWPVIAQGSCGYEHPTADGTGWSIEIRIRRGKYYNLIIHANYDLNDDSDSGGQTVRVGRLINSRDATYELWKNMLEVGDELRARIANEHLKKHVVYALDACFANLKPLTY